MLLNALVFSAQIVAAQPAAALPAPAALADIPNLTVRYYEVQGRDGRTIRRDMNAKRLVDSVDGLPVDAQTRWRHNWRVPGGPSGCDPSRAEVSYTIEMTLPRLAAGVTLSRSEQAEWDRYYKALLGHERNHALMAVRAAGALQSALREAGSCETAKSAADRVLAPLREASAEYDRRTRHGFTEGAVYPNGSAGAPRRGRSR